MRLATVLGLCLSLSASSSSAGSTARVGLSHTLRVGGAVQLTVALSEGSTLVRERRSGSHLELWFERSTIWSTDMTAVSVGTPPFAWARLTDEHGRVRLDLWLDEALAARDVGLLESPRFADGGRLLLLQLPAAPSGAAQEP